MPRIRPIGGGCANLSGARERALLIWRICLHSDFVGKPRLNRRPKPGCGEHPKLGWLFLPGNPHHSGEWPTERIPFTLSTFERATIRYPASGAAPGDRDLMRKAPIIETMRIVRSISVIAAPLVLLLTAGAVLVARQGARPQDDRSQAAVRSPEQAVYVWQRQWSAEVVSALKEAAQATDRLMPLAVEIEMEEGQPHLRRADIDWAMVGALGCEVWAVIRAHDLGDLSDAKARGEAEALVRDVIRQVLAQAGGAAAGVQIDYDCATEGLADYAALVRGLQNALPEVKLSITSLPDWLRSRDFPDLVGGLDHYVLQVHSLTPPTRIDDPITLCDTSRIPNWLEEAGALGRPFFLALPTYGYRFRFDATGDCIGWEAEGIEEAYLGGSTKEVMADPAAIAAVVRAVRAAPPRGWRGFAWFRMPVPGDRLNWSWACLEEVMAGRAPQAEMGAEIREPSAGLYELWLINRGTYRPMEPIRVSVDWRGGELVAHDALGGFEFATSPGRPAGEVVGAAPEPGAERMAAWFRIQPRDAGFEVVVHIGGREGE